MSDINLNEAEVYGCCGICKQLAPGRICDPKWGLLEEFLYSYCFVLSFFLFYFFCCFLHFVPFSYFSLFVCTCSSPHKEMVLVHYLETLLVNTCSVQAIEFTNE